MGAFGPEFFILVLKRAADGRHWPRGISHSIRPLVRAQWERARY